MAEGTNGVAYDSSSDDASASGRRRLAGHADPMERILAMEERSSSTTFIAVGIVAILLHFVVAAQALTMSIELHTWARMVRERVAGGLQDLYEVELAKPPEPPAPPPPEEAKADKPAPPPPSKAAEPPPPPPAAAQAGKILTQEPDPNEPVDLTAGFVSGNSEAYAGGVTQAAGTSKTAVNNLNARANGVPGGTGVPSPVAAAPAVDKSRPAGLLGSSDWNCPWPAEADSEQIDQALVTVAITVGPDGKPLKVDVVKDPGHNFGLEARRCAMRERYQTALDASGNPVTQTKQFKIRFDR